MDKQELTKEEKRDTLRKWNNRTVGMGEINYLQDLILTKVKQHCEQKIRELRIEVGSTAFEKGKKYHEQKGLGRPDRERIKELVRQFYWYSRENPPKGKTLNLETLTEQVAKDILVLTPGEDETDI